MGRSFISDKASYVCEPKGLHGLDSLVGKIAAKLVLARLPLDDTVGKRVHLFECGHMEAPCYAYGVFKNIMAQPNRDGDYVGSSDWS